MALPTAMSRVQFRGVTLNRRTRNMLLWAEKRAGVGTLILAQGSYNVGVAASAGTHDGGGCLDVSVRNLTESERKRVVVALKMAGFAAWFREAVPGLWGAHIHAVAIGDPQLAYGARDQVRSFDAHRSGLRGDAWDATFRPSPKVGWKYLLNRPGAR